MNLQDSSVKRSIYNSVRNSVWKSINDSTKSTVWDYVGEYMRVSVAGSVRRGRPMRDSMSNSVKSKLNEYEFR